MEEDRAKSVANSRKLTAPPTLLFAAAPRARLMVISNCRTAHIPIIVTVEGLWRRKLHINSPTVLLPSGPSPLFDPTLDEKKEEDQKEITSSVRVYVKLPSPLVREGPEDSDSIFVRMNVKLPSPLVFDCHDNRDASRSTVGYGHQTCPTRCSKQKGGRRRQLARVGNGLRPFFFHSPVTPLRLWATTTLIYFPSCLTYPTTSSYIYVPLALTLLPSPSRSILCSFDGRKQGRDEDLFWSFDVSASVSCRSELGSVPDTLPGRDKQIHLFPLSLIASTVREMNTLQGFNWESWSQQGGWYNFLKDKVSDIANAGVTHVWLPPPSHSVAFQGRSVIPICRRDHMLTESTFV
ncbi:alpha-amylase [Musa troglodytarum]|uniref:Alpha-amylase n=1 Tax=Musa troglodytarum TaxID=320322 RepID=A0A9E7FAN3_9LILI|nr:alpha-amylase [Musa troglodytarum]